MPLDWELRFVGPPAPERPTARSGRPEDCEGGDTASGLNQQDAVSGLRVHPTHTDVFFVEKEVGQTELIAGDGELTDEHQGDLGARVHGPRGFGEPDRLSAELRHWISDRSPGRPKDYPLARQEGGVVRPIRLSCGTRDHAVDPTTPRLLR